MFQVQKPKSAGKIMLPHGDDLNKIVLATLERIATMTGITLGPGGRQVLIERQEMNLPPIITKDGVTVVKNLGFENPVSQLVLESVRDVSLRTASEAGDGTTTATILANSITRGTVDAAMLHREHHISPQKLVRELQKMVPAITKMVRDMAFKVDSDNFDVILHRVATLSANGDSDLADAIIKAYNLVGDDGNLTIVDADGDTRYDVEKIRGYTIDMGYEMALKNMATGFFNDPSGSMVKLSNPIVFLYDGFVNDMHQVLEGINIVHAYHSVNKKEQRPIVIFAHGFSDAFLGDMYRNWSSSQRDIEVLPCLTPQTAVMNSGTNFLFDLQAYVDVPVFNPVDRPLASLDAESLVSRCRATKFEMNRFRSSIFANEDADLIEERVATLRAFEETKLSEYDLRELKTRIGKLTCGIARLTIFSPVEGDKREKKDRADDAWMAVRGAVTHGALPGGGHVLVKVAAALTTLALNEKQLERRIAQEILGQALLEPVRTLYYNWGLRDKEIDVQIGKVLSEDNKTYDILNGKWVAKDELLDSAPAVLQAITNSIAIAGLLGTLGGIVSFNRDVTSDKKEEDFVRNFSNSAGVAR